MSVEQHPGVIYIFTNPIGERYIGRTIDYERRMGEYNSGKDRHGDIGPSIDEYGWENHDRRPLMRGIDPAVLVKTETSFIEMLKPELNCKWASGGRVYHAESTKQKMSNDRSGEKHPLFGTKRPQEVRDKISAKLSGRKLPKETCEKMSAARLGYKPPPEVGAAISAAKRGKKFTQEHCDAIRAVRLGTKHTAETRAKMRGRKMPMETRAKMTESHKERHRVSRKHNRIKELREFGWPVLAVAA